jgi:molybdopterin synthase catalytic subunit
VRLCELRDNPISVSDALLALGDDSIGGTVLFVGTVRSRDAGRDVVRLRYEAHPAAAEALHAVAGRVAAECPAVALAVIHRVGELAVGDIAVVVAAAAAHRAAAFDAARRLIDRVKLEVPIWKRQQFGDDTAEWVGAPAQPGAPRG